MTMLPFDAPPDEQSSIAPARSSARGQADRGDAKRSIHFLLEAALRYGKVNGLAELLDSVAALRQYKPYNAMLVLLQRPAATYLLPAHQWSERYGRLIRPNEQPLVMLQRRGPVMFLFDVSQTEAGRGEKPLPRRLDNPYGMPDTPGADEALSWIIENAKADGVRVLPAGHGLLRAGCIGAANGTVTQQVVARRRPLQHRDVRVRYETLLNSAYTPTEQLATLAHELGHLYCGHLGPNDRELWPHEALWPDRSMLDEPEMELEAESVARLVFRRLDPDNPLPDHLSQFFATVPRLPSSNVERVLTASGRILDMAMGHAPRRPRPVAAAG